MEREPCEAAGDAGGTEGGARPRGAPGRSSPPRGGPGCGGFSPGSGYRVSRLNSDFDQ